MPVIIIQYCAMVLFVIAIGYLLYYLKETGIIKSYDYYGIAYSTLGMLEGKEADSLNVKNILRAVSSVVQIVELNYKQETNGVKEEKALVLAREEIDKLHLNSEIENDSIRYIIRLACALLPPTK